MAAGALQNVLKQSHLKVKLIPPSMGYRMAVSRQENHTNLWISWRALGWEGALSTSIKTMKAIFFHRAAGLNCKLNIFSKPCCKQMCCLRALLFHLQSTDNRFSVILRGPHRVGMVNEHWLSLALAPRKRATVWSWKSRIDFSLAIKVFGGIFLQASLFCVHW